MHSYLDLYIIKYILSYVMTTSQETQFKVTEIWYNKTSRTIYSAYQV